MQWISIKRLSYSSWRNCGLKYQILVMCKLLIDSCLWLLIYLMSHLCYCLFNINPTHTKQLHILFPLGSSRKFHIVTIGIMSVLSVLDSITSVSFVKSSVTSAVWSKVPPDFWHLCINSAAGKATRMWHEQ